MELPPDVLLGGMGWRLIHGCFLKLLTFLHAFVSISIVSNQYFFSHIVLLSGWVLFPSTSRLNDALHDGLRIYYCRKCPHSSKSSGTSLTIFFLKLFWALLILTLLQASLVSFTNVLVNLALHVLRFVSHFPFIYISPFLVAFLMIFLTKKKSTRSCSWASRCDYTNFFWLLFYLF